MDGFMDGCMHAWIDRYMDKCMTATMYTCKMNGSGGLMDGWIHGWVSGCIHAYMQENGCTHVCMGELIDGWMKN